MGIYHSMSLPRLVKLEHLAWCYDGPGSFDVEDATTLSWSSAAVSEWVNLAERDFRDIFRLCVSYGPSKLIVSCPCPVDHLCQSAWKLVPSFLLQDAMHSAAYAAMHCLTVCLSVCHVCELKWVNISSNFSLKLRLPSGSPTQNSSFTMSNVTAIFGQEPQTGVLNADGVWKNSDFRLYLWNDTREGISYYGTSLGTRTRVIKWCRFQYPRFQGHDIIQRKITWTWYKIEV